MRGMLWHPLHVLWKLTSAAASSAEAAEAAEAAAAAEAGQQENPDQQVTASIGAASIAASVTAGRSESTAAEENQKQENTIVVAAPVTSASSAICSSQITHVDTSIDFVSVYIVYYEEVSNVFPFFLRLFMISCTAANSSLDMMASWVSGMIIQRSFGM